METKDFRCFHNVPILKVAKSCNTVIISNMRSGGMTNEKLEKLHGTRAQVKIRRQQRITHARSNIVSAVGGVSIAHALSTDADVPNGIEQPPLISGDILREPLGQRLDGTSEPLEPQSDVTSFREFHQLRIRLVRTGSAMNQRDVYLKQNCAEGSQM